MVGRPGVDVTASRRRATVSAANMSPVPEKKQSIAEKEMLKRRGVWSERREEPMTERVGDEVEEPGEEGM